MKHKNKIILSVKNRNGELKFIEQNEDAQFEDYLEFGNGWFTCLNFYKDICIMFKVSPLKKKNREGVNILVFDFVCMKDKNQESINKHLNDIGFIMKKLASITLMMTKKMSLEEHKNYSFMVRQAEPWLVNLGKEK